jgi:hypothetical protein
LAIPTLCPNRRYLVEVCIGKGENHLLITRDLISIETKKAGPFMALP